MKTNFNKELRHAAGLWGKSPLERKLADRGFVPFCGLSLPKAKNPALANVEDVITQPIYDSFSFAQGAAFAKTTIFQTPQGQSSKNLVNTNMVFPGQLQFPQSFVCYALRLWIANNTHITDLINLYNNVSLFFQVGVKRYFEGTPLLLTAGCGAIVTAAAQLGTAPAGSATYTSTSNGTPDQRNIFGLSRPIKIDAGESFSMVFNPDTAFNFTANTTNPPGTGTTIYAILDGELSRQVQ